MKKFIIFILLIVLCIFGFLYYKNHKIDSFISDDYEPKYIINDLYKSKEINYRFLLDENEKELYDIYIQKILNFESSFSIDFGDYEYEHFYEFSNKFSKINQALMMDHPEMFYFGYPSYSQGEDSNSLHIKINYSMNKQQYLNRINEIQKQIDSINEKTTNLTEYEKVLYVYEYLGNKNNYSIVTDAMSQSAYAAFSNSFSPVCAGYARASQLIFSNIGITSMLISGELKSNFIMGDNHEWNVVKIDNKYYNFDVTQSSILKTTTGKISYYGFLVEGNLSPSYRKLSPYINGNDYDYYEINNLEYDCTSQDYYELSFLLNSKYTEIRIKNITKFKMDFDNIKEELDLKTYYVIDDIIILEKN